MLEKDPGDININYYVLKLKIFPQFYLKKKNYSKG